MTQIYSYKINETETIKGYINGKIYAGYVYINPLDENTMTIDFKNSIKFAFDKTKLFKDNKTTALYNESKNIIDNNKNKDLPTTVEGWMKLMEKSER